MNATSVSCQYPTCMSCFHLECARESNNVGYCSHYTAAGVLITVPVEEDMGTMLSIMNSIQSCRDQRKKEYVIKQWNMTARKDRCCVCGKDFGESARYKV